MIKVPINIPTYKRSKRNKKSNPNSWYIYKTKLMLAALFSKLRGCWQNYFRLSFMEAVNEWR